MNTRWNGIVATLTVSLMAACASPTPSQLMTNVKNDLNSPQREALETQFPRLIAEAEEALKNGQKALERGDAGESELYASIANSKFQAAKNLSKSSEIVHQQAAYRDALVSLEEEVEFLSQEAEELRRFQALDARFREATSSLEKYEGMEGTARESLALARKKQAEAIRVGAPQLATGTYREGQVLTESALSSLDRGDFESTIELSGEATAAFETSISKSKDSAVAQRRLETERAQKQETLDQKRSKALTLIEKAVDMKAAAIAEGADQKAPNLFQQANFLLSRAEMAAEDERFEQAGDSAKKSASSFEKAIKAKEEPAKTSVAAATKSEGAVKQTPVQNVGVTAPRSSPSSSASREQILRFLTRAQMQRAEALGRGDDEECPNAFQEFEAVLEIAEERLRSGDQFYALEHAIRAQERLRLCARSGQDAAPKTRGSSSEAKSPTKPSPRAATPADSTAGSESATTSAAKDTQKSEEEKLSPLEQAARDRAIKALIEADLVLARSQFQGASRASLSRATSLRDTAEKSFDRKDYARATLYADLVTEELSPEKKEKPEEESAKKSEGKDTTRGQTKNQEVSSMSRKEKAKKDAASTSGDAATTGKEDATQCPENRSLASYLEEQYRKQKYASQSRGETTWAPPVSLEAANALDKEGRCKRAREFYQRAANELFDSRQERASDDEKKKADDEKQKAQAAKKDDTTRKRVVVTRQDRGDVNQRDKTQETKETPEVDEAARQRALKSLAESQRKLAALGPKAEGPALELSSRLVKKSQDAYEAGRFDDAYMLSEQAVGAMQSISSDQREIDTGSQEWKGAYQQVLDALIARDRAATLANSKTQKVFDRGVNFLDRARKSWSSKDYRAAEKYAKASLEDFKEVMDNAEEAQKKAAEQKAAEKAQVQREEVAREQATRKELKKEASSALSNAEIKFELCEEKHCRKRDSRKFLTGSQKLENARAAMDAKTYEEAARLANQASQSFDDALATRLELTPATSEHLKVSEGEIVLSPRIKFELGSTRVDAASMESVRALADYLRDNQRVLESVTITGHTDSKGKAESNRKLSRERAQSVADNLRSLGVDPSLLKIVGMGESQPIASNDNADGRARNRRVEIRYNLHSE